MSPDEDLQALADFAQPFLAALSPQSTRKLMRRIAAALAKNQSQRIRRQQNPDGTPFEPRKIREKVTTQKIKANYYKATNSQGETRHGKSRKAAERMFEKISRPKHIKAVSDDVSATVGFLSRTARIARIHQYGLSDRPGPNTKAVVYPQRELLGFTAKDMEMVRDFVVQAATDPRGVA